MHYVSNYICIRGNLFYEDTHMNFLVRHQHISSNKMTRLSEMCVIHKKEKNFHFELMLKFIYTEARINSYNLFFDGEHDDGICLFCYLNQRISLEVDRGGYMDVIAIMNSSREELIKKVNELQNLLDAMKADKDNQELINFPWVGNLGNWYWSLIDNTVIFNDQKVLALGYSREEIPQKIGFEYFTEKIHPDDHDQVMENMRSHLYGKTPAYETTYRIQAKNGSWKWFYDRGKVTKRSDSGKPELVVGIVFDVTEQKQMEEQLAQKNQQLLELSMVDFLTKIFNRRALFEKLEQEKSRSDRYSNPFSILMIDIDHFKNINDSYGHLVGDNVLIQVAATIGKIIRKIDFLGRYGGEEFMVILPEINLSGGVNVAEKIRLKIQDSPLTDNIKLTISLGVAEYKAGTSIDDLISLADSMLYAAKKNGRNQVKASLV